MSSSIPERKQIKIIKQKLKTMKEVKFYTVEEKNIMKQMLSSGENRRSVARKLAIQFDRSEYALYQKLGAIKNTIPTLKPSVVNQCKSKIKQEKINFEPDLHKTKEQQPADIGVDVPHGMTFEGKPKRITLHSDHFRIYF